MNGRSEGDFGPRRLKDSLDQLLHTMRAPSVDILEAIFRRWPEIVGADLAEHCRPVSVKGDLLTVQTVDPAWAAEVRWLESQVLARVAAVSGSDRIARLVVKVRRR